MRYRPLSALLLAALLPAVLSGCSPSQPTKPSSKVVDVEEIDVPAADAAKEAVADATAAAKEAVDAAKQEADRVIDEAKQSAAKAADAVDEKVDAATEAVGGAVDAAKDTATAAVAAAGEKAAEMKERAAAAVDAAKQATGAAVEQATDAAADAADAVKEAVKDGAAAVQAAAEQLPEAIQNAVVAGMSLAPQSVELGAPALTAGVPGTGPITIAEIDAWLADPENHVELDPVLPLGLATGANQITGIDSNPLTRAKIELGRQLYFDTRLSKNSTISCASCHNPAEGYAAHTQFGVGIDDQEGGRNSPVSYNRILSGAQFWDGRVDSLEAQAVGPIANPIEMGFTHEGVVERLSQIPVYRRQFEAIFGGVTIDAVGQAIATFERAIVTGPSPWDYYEALLPFEALDEEDIADDEDLAAKYAMLTAGAEANPMSDSAKRGRDIFFTEKGNCTACHVGANLADEKYHNLGVGMEKEEPDLGRFVVTGDEKDKGAFKTPTVRNVALTAPYMHDGSQQTLEEVVEWYNKGGHPNPYLSDKVRPLNLTEQEKADLVEFMKACTGPTPSVETSRLPAES